MKRAHQKIQHNKRSEANNKSMVKLAGVVKNHEETIIWLKRRGVSSLLLIYRAVTRAVYQCYAIHVLPCIQYLKSVNTSKIIKRCQSWYQLCYNTDFLFAKKSRLPELLYIYSSEYSIEIYVLSKFKLSVQLYGKWVRWRRYNLYFEALERFITQKSTLFFSDFCRKCHTTIPELIIIADRVRRTRKPSGVHSKNWPRNWPTLGQLKLAFRRGQ